MLYMVYIHLSSYWILFWSIQTQHISTCSWITLPYFHIIITVTANLANLSSGHSYTSCIKPLFADLFLQICQILCFMISGLEVLKIWSNGANWSKTNLFWLFHARKAQKYPKSKKWLMSLKISIFLGWNIECVD